MGHLQRFPGRWPLALYLLAACLFAPPLQARTFLLKPDGTGDVSTFQAGIDSLIVNPSCGSQEYDTLFVAPGFYDEEVHADISRGHNRNCDVHGVVLGIEGFDRTEVRAIRFAPITSPYVSPYGCGHKLLLEGFTVQQEVKQEPNSQCFARWFRCRFAGGFSSTLPRGTGVGRSFEGCEFRQFALLQGYGGFVPLESCHFIGARTVLDGTEHGLEVRNCRFEGPVDTAVVANTGGDGGIRFVNCIFSGMTNAIVLKPDSYVYHFSIGTCGFSRIAGAAVAYTKTSVQSYDRPGGFSISNSSFTDCGTALRVHSSLGETVGLVSDTITASSGMGIDAAVSSLGMQSCTIRDCKGTGAKFRIFDVPEWAGTLSIVDSRFADNEGNGLELADSSGAEGYEPAVAGCLFERNALSGLVSSAALTYAGNTSVLNGGAGLAIHPPDFSTDPLAVESNLVAGNDGAGLGITCPYTGSVSHNDAWMNRGGDYLGVPSPADSNLTLDPQFCDPLREDFHVASSSPCAPSGPYGQIGALGVGCDVMTVGVDVQPSSNNTINLRSNAPVNAAILGHRLFDPHRVDPSTVRLAGAPPSSRGAGTSTPQLRDLNGDGFADLLLCFNSRDLDIQGEEAMLEGRTFDGAPFHGTDVVQVRNPASKAGMEALLADLPKHLGLAVPQSHGAVTLLLALPRAEPVRLEVFDIAGRRVVSRELSGLGAGRQRVDLEERFSPGVYMLRLTQATETAVARAVVLE